MTVKFYTSVILLLSTSADLISFANGEGCKIRLNQRKIGKKEQGPILTNWADGSILYPDIKASSDDNSVISIDSGKVLGVDCHQTEYVKGVLKGRGVAKMKLTCDSKGNFLNQKGEVTDVHQLSCTKKFEPVIRLSKSRCAPLGADGRNVENQADHGLLSVQIGWNITNSKFQTQIDLCVDNKAFGTLWTRHVILPSVEFKETGHTRPKFASDTKYPRGKKSRFFGGASKSTLEKTYKKSNAKKSFIRQLGHNQAPGGNGELLSSGHSATNYFAKGHLTPDASAVYEYQQRATYYFINVAPQFQAFNNGNWKFLEIAARKLAAKKGRKLTMYQGTQDILSYANKDGVDTELYLDYISRGKVKAKIPIPLYFWKIIHDEEKNEAVAFVGTNDIFADESSNFLCNNVCDQLKWAGVGNEVLNWDVEEIAKGKMACCQVDAEFKDIVDVSPDLSDENNNWPTLLAGSK